jgi:hypothetical protein
MFDGESGKLGIGDAGTARCGRASEPFENFPMAPAGHDARTVWLRHEIVAKAKRFGDRAWFPENARIARNTYKCRERQRRYAELRVTLRNAIEPRFAICMSARVAAERVNEDVYVR